MSVISATSRNCKTMADGTLRLTIDVEPRNAQDAFQLFGMPDVPMVLARLTQEAAIQSARAETIEADKPKGGALAKLAGMWCNQVDFYGFILPVYDKIMGGNGDGFGDIENVSNLRSSEICRHALLVMCDIDSRSELDSDPAAADKFHKLIREPYSEYLKRNV